MVPVVFNLLCHVYTFCYFLCPADEQGWTWKKGSPGPPRLFLFFLLSPQPDRMLVRTSGNVLVLCGSPKEETDLYLVFCIHFLIHQAPSHNGSSHCQNFKDSRILSWKWAGKTLSVVCTFCVYNFKSYHSITFNLTNMSSKTKVRTQGEGQEGKRPSWGLGGYPLETHPTLVITDNYLETRGLLRKCPVETCHTKKNWTIIQKVLF